MTRPDDDALSQIRDKIAGQTSPAETEAPPDPETVSRIAAILAGPRLRRARQIARRLTADMPRRDGP